MRMIKQTYELIDHNVNIYICSLKYIRLTQTIFWDLQFQFSMLDQTYSQEFEVEQIVDEKMIDSETHYLVKWVGYGHEENTWEPLRHMTNSKDKIKKWEKFKQKHLTLLHNFQTLDKLDLGPPKSPSPNPIQPSIIEGTSKSSTPYRNFKPIILLGNEEKQHRLQIEEKGKTISLFDRPEVKKITKRKKIQRKKKELEIFQQRMKSRPKVWEKYLQNEDQAIKLANKKIKQVVDEVFGSKIGLSIPQVSVEAIQQKKEKSSEKISYEGSAKMTIIEKKDGMNRIMKKKAKALEIFSDSEEETSHLQQPMKMGSGFKSTNKTLHQQDDLSESINESTNFISHKIKQKTDKEEPSYQQTKSFIQNQTKRNIPSINQYPNQMATTKQANIAKYVFQESQYLRKEEALKALRTKSCLKPDFIQPETVRLTNGILKMLDQPNSQKIQTEESSSQSQVQQGCKSNNLQKSQSSSFSSSPSDHQGENAFKLSISPKMMTCPGDQKDKQFTSNDRPYQDDLQCQELMGQNFRAKINPKSQIQIEQKTSNQNRKLLVKFDEFIKVSESFQINHKACDSDPIQIKVQESRNYEKSSSKNDHVKQQQKSVASSHKSSTKNIAQNIKLEWFSRIKLPQDSIHKLKDQAEVKSPTKIKTENNIFLVESKNLIPFACSISTIEGLQTSDQYIKEKQDFTLEKAPQIQQSSDKQQPDSENSGLNNGQRIINYSSMTNHRSTALPSQGSGQSFHVFTNQNGFNLNLLRNHSLSTRASLNSHRTEVEGGLKNNGRNTHNSEGRVDGSNVMNEGIYQSTPEHIFSSSQEIQDRVNLTDVENIQKYSRPNKSLSLQQILQLIQDKSFKQSNIIQSKDECGKYVKKLLNLKTKTINLIELDSNQPSIQISNYTTQTKNLCKSNKSSPIILDFMEIGSQNRFTKPRISQKITDLKIAKQSIEKQPSKMHWGEELSDFHRMFILENNLTEI